MFENYEWKQSKITPYGNIFHFYPNNDDSFKKEVAENGGLIIKVYKNSELIHTQETKSSEKEWKIPVFSYLRNMSIKSNYFDYYFQDCEFYAVPKNYGYILDSQTEKISLAQEERELFSQALQELIFEVDKCVKRDKRTKQGKISHAGTTSQNIKEYLSFLKKYGIDYQVGIGNSWGFLNPDSWIIFAPSKILNEKLVNGKTLTPTKGVYTYFSYFGYLQGEKGYGLYFGFPNGEKNQRHGDPNKSQCVAVRKMQEDDALQTYDFTYTHLDFEKIINDFEAMMNYFMQFSSIEFTSENLLDKDNQSSKDRKFWLYKSGENGDKWEDMYAKGLMGLGWKNLGDLSKYSNKEEIEAQLNILYPRHTTDRVNDRKSNWDFCNEMEVGDIVIVGSGKTKFLGYGKVESDYFYDPSLDESFASFRKVNWIKKGEWDWEKQNDNDGGWAIKALTNITQYKTALDSLLNLIGFYDKENEKMNQENNNNALNQILYGSPGTGKTYSTIDKALEILGVNTKDMSREERKKIFEDYKQKGQIEFVTFHQSYGYEEFVEGIKPLTDKDKNVYYEVTNGIFKELCYRARFSSQTRSVNKELCSFIEKSIKNETLFQMQKGENFKIKSFENEKISCEKLNPKDGENLPNDLRFSMLQKILDSNVLINNPSDIQKSFTLDTQTPSYYYPIYKKFKEESQITPSKQPYILIIDEINRGNISKIFGELITLIEPSKRIGEKEEIKVKLPYSQEEFGVPNNLYIIGTMNTADRSITSLDTALRRRFEFVEMMPKPSELSKTKVSQDGKEINLSKMLEFINKRIEFLYDREKIIGHAFFLQDEGQTSLDITELKSIFQNKIIPLLQEYFYNDYAQIQAVLNCNGMIKKSEEKIQDLFAMDKLGNELDLEDKAIYTIADKEDELWLNPQTYIDIYKKN